ncbi:MAG TPA: hypothetical protein VNE63_14355 [Candidatus Acidoferrales bacterium]|nr:hypothetical protein [Candidatus Acidoferrales bacterium]
MLNPSTSAMRNQALIGIGLFGFALWAAWDLGGKIVQGDLRSLSLAAVAAVACAIAIATLRNWRNGLYIFIVCLLFEDLVRKYMGNGGMFFFAKDAVLALVYMSLFLAIRRRREKTFRPPFLALLGIFFWLGVLQIFNVHSPSILYGLLGIKVDFYYFPLIFVGYALVRNDEDLRKFLVVNMALASVISLLGIIQAIVGNSFLNPANLAPDLQDLGDLSKLTPLSHQMLSLPDSVFVSSGRLAVYLVVAFILAMGAAAYFLLHTTRHRKVAFVTVGLLAGASLMSGSRTAVVYTLASALVLSAAFLWGAPQRQDQAYRLRKSIRRSFIVAALGFAALLVLFPDETGSRIGLYMETLNPSSSASDVSYRSWDYPIQNLMFAFDRPNWVLGNGTGTASLGTQYVARFLGQPAPNLWVEEGYGVLMIEMGIIAPFLWILWTAALIYSSWKVVRRLKRTRFFPIAFAFLWFAFVLLYPLTYLGLSPYQNYVCNAYLWLFVGILFRLPDLQASAPTAVAASGA